MKKLLLFVVILYFICPFAAFAQNNPPTNFQAAFNHADRAVLMSWIEPTVDPFVRLIIDNGDATADGFVGYPNGQNFYAANHFQAPADFTLTGIQAYYRFEGTTVTAKVYDHNINTGFPGAEVHSQDYPFSTPNGMMHVLEFDEPIPLTEGEHFWVGMYFSTSEPYPQGTDDVPLVSEMSAFSANGTDWSLLYDVLGTAPDGTPNVPDGFVIRAIDATGDVVRTIVGRQSVTVREIEHMENNPAESDVLASATNPNPGRDNWTLNGYHIYRHTAPEMTGQHVIDQVPAGITNYIDDYAFVENEDYFYAVSAVYEDGESVLSNIVEVTIPYEGEVELGYDDGDFEYGVSSGFPGLGFGFAVFFQNPANNDVNLIKLKYFMRDYPEDMTEFVQFTAHVYSDTLSGFPVEDLMPPLSVTPDVSAEEWFVVNLYDDPVPIAAGAGFFVGLTEGAALNRFGADNSTPHDHQSLLFDGGSNTWIHFDDLNEPFPFLDLMIRVSIVEPNSIEATEIELTAVGLQVQQNFPNPFNPTTTLSFSIEKAAPVSVLIYNSTGQLVNALMSNQLLHAGRHQITWDGLNLNGQKASSGLYFYTIQAGDSYQVNDSMILLK